MPEPARSTRPLLASRHCWLRLRRHRWQRTGSFRFGGAFVRGWALRCVECGHTTLTVNRNLIERADA